MPHAVASILACAAQCLVEVGRRHVGKGRPLPRVSAEALRQGAALLRKQVGLFGGARIRNWSLFLWAVVWLGPLFLIICEGRENESCGMAV